MKKFIIGLAFLMLLPVLVSAGQVDSIQTGITYWTRQSRAIVQIDTVLYLMFFDTDTTANRSELHVSYDNGATWVISDKTPFGVTGTYLSDVSSIVSLRDTLYGTNNDAGGLILAKYLGDTSHITNTIASPDLLGSPGYVGMAIRNDSLILLVDVGAGLAHSGFISDGAWGASSEFLSSADTVFTGYSATAYMFAPVANGIGMIYASSAAPTNSGFFFTDGYTNKHSHVANAPWTPASLTVASITSIADDNDTLYAVFQIGDSLMVIGGYVDSNDSLVITDSVFLSVDGPTTVNGDEDILDPIISMLGRDLYVFSKDYPDPANDDSIRVVYFKATNITLGSLAFDALTEFRPATGADTLVQMNAPQRFSDNAIDVLVVGWLNDGGANAYAMSIYVDTIDGEVPPVPSAEKGYYKGAYLKGGQF